MDLLNMCRRSQLGFTLGDIVELVIAERPGKIRDFVAAWGEIHHRGLVRVRRPGRPATYELVLDKSSELPSSMEKQD